MIIAIIATAFCGCNKSEENPDSPQFVTNPGEISASSLKLAYSKADTLDPFSASMSANIQVLGLIYKLKLKKKAAEEPDVEEPDITIMETDDDIIEM